MSMDQLICRATTPSLPHGELLCNGEPLGSISSVGDLGCEREYQRSVNVAEMDLFAPSNSSRRRIIKTNSQLETLDPLQHSAASTACYEIALFS